MNSRGGAGAVSWLAAPLHKGNDRKKIESGMAVAWPPGATSQSLLTNRGSWNLIGGKGAAAAVAGACFQIVFGGDWEAILPLALAARST